jgi:hypothetical protein
VLIMEELRRTNRPIIPKNIEADKKAKTFLN